MVQEFTLTNTGHHAAAGVNHAAQKTHELTAKTKSHGLSGTDSAFHQIADGSKAPKGKGLNAAKAAARKTIPLEHENSGSNDLKSFNS
jgi:hypothetical protein